MYSKCKYNLIINNKQRKKQVIFSIYTHTIINFYYQYFYYYYITLHRVISNLERYNSNSIIDDSNQ